MSETCWSTMCRWMAGLIVKLSWLTCLLGLSLLMVGSETVAQEKLALLVGVGEYLRPQKFTTLQYAEADAKAIQDLLESSGYRVEVLLGAQATRENVLQKLQDVSSAVTPGGRLILGFFGHGVQYASDAYYCPHDADVRQIVNADGQKVWGDDGRPLLEPMPETLVPMSEILTGLAITDAEYKWLLADCCRDRPHQPRGGADGNPFGTGIASTHLPMNAAAMFACSKGEQAYESSEWGHGAFTRAILDVAQESEQTTVNELSVSVHRKVRDLVGASGKRQTVHTVINGGIVDLDLYNPIRRQSALLNQQSLNQLLPTIAENFIQVLVDREIRDVELLPLKDDTSGNFGPGLQQRLGALLRKGGIVLRPTSDTKLSGRLCLSDNDNDRKTPESQRLLTVELQLMVHRDQEVLARRSVFLNRSSEIAQISGVTADFGVDSPGVRDAHRRIREQVGLLVGASPAGDLKPDPPFRVEGTAVRVHPKSPIAVEILVGSGGGEGTRTEPRVPVAGIAYPLIPLEITEFYEVRVRNDSEREYAISLAIDGLDQFTFSEDRDPETGQPRFTHWILPAKSSLTIPGWHVSSDPNRRDNFQRFTVTTYGDGASRLIAHPDKSSVGVLTLAVAESYLTTGLSRSSRAETGFGPDVTMQQAVVERKVEPPHEFLSIRYRKPD